MCASSQIMTHHDSSDADAHISNDVEFSVEELLNACLTVLHTEDRVKLLNQIDYCGTVSHSLDNKAR